MKRILAMLLALVLCLSVFVACEVPGVTDETTDDGTKAPETEAPENQANVESARAYLKNMYKKYLTENETAADFTLVSQVMVNGVAYVITWTTNTDKVTVEENKDAKEVVINVDEKAEEALDYILTATITDPDGKTAVLEFKLKVPKYSVATYEEYMAAAAGKAVVIEGIVTAVHAQSEGNKYNQLYLQDANGNGGYYVYSISNQDPANMGIKAGMTVKVTGTKDIYNGLHEVKDATIEILDNTVADVAAKDITEAFMNAADLKAEELVNKLGMLVTIKGAEITSQDLAEKSMYFKFKLGNNESYIRVYETDCPASVSDEDMAAIIAGHAEHKGWTADVTGVVVVYGGAIYLNPVSKDCFVYNSMIERTDAEKVDLEAEAVTVTGKVAMDSVIELPVKGTTYENVTIAWSSDNACAVVDEAGKLTITLQPEAQTVTLTAVYTAGEATKTVTYTIEVAAAPTLAPEVVDTPAENVAYKFYIAQKTAGKTLYLDGGVSGRYLTMTEDVSKAIDVYYEKVEGGVKFYTLVDDAKQYIEIYSNDDGKTSVKYDANGVCVYTYDATTYTWRTTFNGTEFYLGTYNNFETVSASQTSYINAENTRETQFPMELVTLVEEKEDNGIVSEPQAETAYKFYLTQVTANKVLYLDGGVSTRYLTMTDDITKAVDVYAEKVDAGYKFYILVDGAKQYIVVYSNDEDKISVKYDANGNCVYTYNATTFAWETTLEGTVYYLGTYSNFETVSASKTSYISAENTKVSQFPLELVTGAVSAPENKPEDKPEEKPEDKPEEGGNTNVVETPEASKAYKFYLTQVTSNKVLYIDGGVSTRYLTMTDDVTKAVDVYAEKVDAGYKFYILVSGAKQYIEVYSNDEDKISVKYDANGTCVYTYNKTTYAWETTVAGTVYYLGTYSNFETVSASKTSYISAENTRVSQFPLELVEGAVSAPENKPEEKPEGGATEIPAGGVKYEFTSLKDGEQYQYDERKLDDNVTMKLTECHLKNGEIRIYNTISDQYGNHDGNAVFACSKVVAGIAVNAGNKDDNLLVYASVDGVNYELVATLAIVKGYNDAGSVIDAAKGYKFIKLDAQSAQLRVKSVTLTFAE